MQYPPTSVIVKAVSVASGTPQSIVRYVSGLGVVVETDPLTPINPCGVAALIAHADHFHRDAGENAACVAAGF